MSTRYSRNLQIQKTHLLVGLAISLLFTLIVALQGFNLWIWQAEIVSSLLSFAGVPHSLFILNSTAKGPTFEMSLNSHPIPIQTVVGVVIALALVVLILNIYRRIPSPVKTIALVVSLVTVLTLLWQSVISPIPSYNVHWVTLDWSCSGLVSLCLIAFIYTPFLFTITGPLWAKVFWLFTTIGFALAWNLLRMSLVTATLYYFGGPVFLIFHYLAGIFIDFVYIVAFYSLALAHISKFQIAGVMKVTL